MDEVTSLVTLWISSITEMIESSSKSKEFSWVAVLLETDFILQFLSFTQDDNCYESILCLINVLIFRENKTQLVWLSKLHICVVL